MWRLYNRFIKALWQLYKSFTKALIGYFLYFQKATSKTWTRTLKNLGHENWTLKNLE